MYKLGVVLHVSGRRNLILRTKGKIKVKIGTQVLNEMLKPVGKISDVFGPVKTPYISVKPMINELESYVGNPLYIIWKNKKVK